MAEVGEPQKRPQKVLEGVENPIDQLLRALRWWLLFRRLFKFALAGIAGIILGFALLLLPGFRANPDKITLNEIATGIAAMIVGVVILSFFIIGFRKR